MPRILSLLTVIAAFVPAAGATTISLDSDDWLLAKDPLRRGETLGWHKPGATAADWDKTAIPHCWTTDARYGEYTGIMWYRHTFTPPAPAPGETAWRLTLEAIGERSRVWLNGLDLGAHDSAGVPVIIDLAGGIKPGEENTLVLAVDNTWDTTTIPGARHGGGATDQVYPWLNYGGILGSVRLEVLPAAHVALQKIDAAPTGENTARLVLTLWPGPGGFGENPAITVEIIDPAQPGRAIAAATLPPPAPGAQTLSATLDLANISGWDLSSRRLYESRVALRAAAGAARTHTATFGIREIRLAAARFLLNGKPVYRAGANRARGHPALGGLGTPESVARDLRLMKDAGLVFARLQHHPVNEHVLDWADRNGMLVIVEYPAWGMTAAELANETVRARYRAGMGALMRASWNHPSVVGWSVGNEYESWTPEGVAWTRDMAAFVRRLDPSRPVTFAALERTLREHKKNRGTGDPSLALVDFLCPNIYFDPGQIPSLLDPLHDTFPEKPVFIAEFGLRADRVKSERERIAHFDRMFSLVRARPWICGFSYWSFNDYPSRYPGTGADGHRRWGLVDEHRRPRDLYKHVQTQLLANDWAR
jgi:beta-glucuronidase